MGAAPDQQGSIVFAGGGSGGHLSPGLAIAERLITVAPEIGSVFLCSDRAVDAMMLREAGANFLPMPARPPSLRPMALLATCDPVIPVSMSARLASKHRTA